MVKLSGEMQGGIIDSTPYMLIKKNKFGKCLRNEVYITLETDRN